MKTKHQDPDYRKIYEEGQAKRDNIQSEITIEKRRKSMIAAMEQKFPVTGRKQRLELGSDELKLKLSESSNKRWAQPGAKEKQSAISSERNKGMQHRLGHINTPEHTAKIVAANTGKKRTDEQRKNIGDAKRGTKWTEEQKAAHALRIKEMWALRKSKVINN
jgi:hypothetical protein